MVNNSTASSLNTKKREQRTMTLEIQVLAWDRHEEKCGVVEPINEITTRLQPSPLLHDIKD